MKTFSYLILFLLLCVGPLFSQNEAMPDQNQGQCHNTNEIATMLAEQMRNLNEEEQEKLEQQFSLLISTVEQMKLNGHSPEEISDFLKNISKKKDATKSSKTGILVGITIIAIAAICVAVYLYLSIRKNADKVRIDGAKAYVMDVIWAIWGGNARFNEINQNPDRCTNASFYIGNDLQLSYIQGYKKVLHINGEGKETGVIPGSWKKEPQTYDTLPQPSPELKQAMQTAYGVVIGE